MSFEKILVFLVFVHNRHVGCWRPPAPVRFAHLFRTSKVHWTFEVQNR